jgi:hypothetical protein
MDGVESRRTRVSKTLTPRILSVGVVLAALLCGCQTGPKLKPVDLAEPGWKLHRGQALWQSKREAPEIAGEVVLAVHTDGRAFIQFLKNPLPLVSAEVGPNGWHIDFIPQKRSFSGRGIPPRQLIWLHLLRGLQEIVPPEDFTMWRTFEGGTRIEDKRTGETITLFLNEQS